MFSFAYFLRVCKDGLHIFQRYMEHRGDFFRREAILVILDDGIGGEPPGAYGSHPTHLLRITLDDRTIGPIDVSHLQTSHLLVSHLRGPNRHRTHLTLPAVAATYSAYGPLKSSIAPCSKCQIRVATSSIKS